MAPPATAPTLDAKTIEELENKRDAFVTSMTTLSFAAQTAARSGYEYFNLLIAKGGPLPSIYPGEGPISFNAHMARAMSVVPEEPLSDGKKKRKRGEPKEPKDPDEPKRPLSSYMLFLKAARPIISKDMDGKGKPLEVSAEAARRWKDLPADEKEAWAESARQEKLQYYKRVDAYRASKGLPPISPGRAQIRNQAAAEKDIEEEEEAEEEEGVDAETGAEEQSEDEEEEDLTPPPPPKKSKAATAAKTNGTASKAATKATGTPKSNKVAPPKSPIEKATPKRKRATKKDKEDAAAAAAAAKAKGKDKALVEEEHSITLSETPKAKKAVKKSRRKSTDAAE